MTFDESQLGTQQQVDSLLEAADLHTHEHHFATNLNLGWQKLNKYYSLLDVSPIYVTAIVLHPAMKWKFLEQRWRRVGKGDWIRRAKRAFKNLCDEVDLADTAFMMDNPTVPPLSLLKPTPLRRQPGAAAFFGEEFIDTDTDEDLAAESAEFTLAEQLTQYLRDTSHRHIAVKDSKGNQQVGLTLDDLPVFYWQVSCSRWSDLTKMALNIYSTPTMSDEPERQFSTSGSLLSPKRALLYKSTIQALMCLQS